MGCNIRGRGLFRKIGLPTWGLGFGDYLLRVLGVVGWGVKVWGLRVDRNSATLFQGDWTTYFGLRGYSPP